MNRPKEKIFSVFDQAEIIVGFVAEGIAETYSNKDMKDLTEWVQRPQIGAKGLVYIKWMDDDSIKSTIGKFYNDDTLKSWFALMGGKKEMSYLLCRVKPTKRANSSMNCALKWVKTEPYQTRILQTFMGNRFSIAGMG